MWGRTDKGGWGRICNRAKPPVTKKPPGIKKDRKTWLVYALALSVWIMNYWFRRSQSLFHLSREIYGESQVLEVQFAYDFVKLKRAQRKVLAARMGREHCEELLRKTKERPLTKVSTNKLSPCCHCCCASHVDGIEYFTEEEEKEKVEADQHEQELKSLEIAFVTFENAEIAERYNNSKVMETSVARRTGEENSRAQPLIMVASSQANIQS